MYFFVLLTLHHVCTHTIHAYSRMHTHTHTHTHTHLHSSNESQGDTQFDAVEPKHLRAKRGNDIVSPNQRSRLGGERQRKGRRRGGEEEGKG